MRCWQGKECSSINRQSASSSRFSAVRRHGRSRRVRKSPAERIE
jgi:hypothetical protein